MTLHDWRKLKQSFIVGDYVEFAYPNGEVVQGTVLCVIAGSTNGRLMPRIVVLWDDGHESVEYSDALNYADLGDAEIPL